MSSLAGKVSLYLQAIGHQRLLEELISLAQYIISFKFRIAAARGAVGGVPTIFINLRLPCQPPTSSFINRSMSEISSGQ